MPMDANKPNDQILQIDIAAKSLRDHANSKLRQGMKGAAGLALDGNEAVAGVVDDWFSEKATIENFPHTINPACLRPIHRRFTPIVFPHRFGNNVLLSYRPDRCNVLIALEDLSFENGLPQWDKGPSKLSKGNWTWIRGDQVWMLGENGGGLAIWLELKLSPSSQDQIRYSLPGSSS